jgi:hypothetical protein
VTRAGDGWRLTVAYRSGTNGPLTTGFVRAEEFDNPTVQTQFDCDLI